MYTHVIALQQGVILDDDLNFLYIYLLYLHNIFSKYKISLSYIFIGVPKHSRLPETFLEQLKVY